MRDYFLKELNENNNNKGQLTPQNKNKNVVQ